MTSRDLDPRRPLALCLLGLVLLLAPVAGGAQGPAAASTPQGGRPTAEAGRELFRKLGCAVCHAVVPRGGPTGGPRLFRSFGRKQRLTGGKKVRIDERYLRESILRPGAKIAAGYRDKPMPPFAGVLADDQVRALVLYIKSLR